MVDTPEQRRMSELAGLVSRRQRSMRGPFKYPGSKYNLLAEILPHLPYKKAYIEVFGGTGVILLSRQPQSLEVFNDRYSAITDFFLVLRDHLEELEQRLEFYMHSREEWERCHATWNDPSLDRIERAARWYYALQYSFAGKMDVWGRITKSTATVAGTLQRKLKKFDTIRMRMMSVQIENLDWLECINDYDQPGAVFYLDPPYHTVDSLSYNCSMTSDDHVRLMERIQTMQGFVAISGVANDLYDSYKWDDVRTFHRKNCINACAVSEYNHRKTKGERKPVEERLWIKHNETL